MKKLLLIFTILFVFFLTACSLTGGEEAKEHLKPLDPAAWPTTAAQAAMPSPTPFPKAALPPTVIPTEQPEATATATPVEPLETTTSMTSTTEANTGGNANAETLAAMAASALASQFSIVATGFVTAGDAAILEGPGSNYGIVTPIAQGNVFGVLGKNAGSDWLYILDASLKPGWLPVSQLRLLGSLEEARVLPPNPLAALAQSISATSSNETANTSSETAGASSPPAVDVTSLSPVTTAQVNNEGLNLRQGPGASYERITTLANNDKVTILALNPRKDWALVETDAKQRGWAALTYLTVAGSLAAAPTVPAEVLSQASAAGQPAPVADSAEPAVANGATTAAAPVPVSNETANPAAIFGNLGPVASAKITRVPVDIRPGPGTAYAPIDDLRQTDETISILAVDKSGQWALVNSTSAQIGWAALTDLQIEGSLANAPQVNTAWVESNAVEVRRGPGIYQDVVGVLSINTLVSVLGLDDGRSWALVKAIPAGGLGWAPINFLKPVGRWSDLPQAPDLPDNSATTSQAEAATPFTPVRPVSQSQIVFQRSSGGDIMVINPDGTGLHHLTNGIDPVLSANGQKVAFTRWEGETGSLWVINTDGSNERSIVGFVKQAKGPDWSPDESQIVFNFQNGGRIDPKTECFGLGDGKNPPRPPRNATNFKVKLGEDASLCWTLPPDPHWGLRVVNLTDGKAKDIDGGTYAFRPAWDPSQPWRIVSDGGRGLLEVDVNRDYRQDITAEINDGSPVFSPDGRYLAVTMGQQGGGPGWDIYRLNANGTGRVRLTQTPLWETATPDNDKAWNNVAPAWSPDGSQIAFLTDRNGGWEIWVMNADGSNPHPLFSAEINKQLQLTYNFVDERVLSWR